MIHNNIRKVWKSLNKSILQSLIIETFQKQTKSLDFQTSFWKQPTLQNSFRDLVNEKSSEVSESSVANSKMLTYVSRMGKRVVNSCIPEILPKDCIVTKAQCLILWESILIDNQPDVLIWMNQQQVNSWKFFGKLNVRRFDGV